MFRNIMLMIITIIIIAFIAILSWVADIKFKNNIKLKKHISVCIFMLIFAIIYSNDMYMINICFNEISYEKMIIRFIIIYLLL